MTATTTATRVRTLDGDRVNPYSDLCEVCAQGVAQTATYWATGDGSTGTTMKARLDRIAQTVRESQEFCRERCGRVEAI